MTPSSAADFSLTRRIDQQDLGTKREPRPPFSSSAKSFDHASCSGEFECSPPWPVAADLLAWVCSIVLGYPPKDNDFSFNNNLNFKLYELVKQYSMGKP